MMSDSALIRSRGELWKSQAGQSAIDECIAELSWAVKGAIRLDIITKFANKLRISVIDMEDMLKRTRPPRHDVICSNT